MRYDFQVHTMRGDLEVRGGCEWMGLLDAARFLTGWQGYNAEDEFRLPAGGRSFTARYGEVRSVSLEVRR